MFIDAANLQFVFSGVGVQSVNDYPFVRGVTAFTYKLEFAGPEDCTISFDQITGINDFTFHLYVPSTQANISFTILGNTYTIDKKPGWKRFVVNTSGPVSSFVISSDFAVNIFIDKLGGRNVGYTMDTDMINDFVSQISIVLNKSTTLAADLSERSIKLTDTSLFSADSTIKIGSDVLRLKNLETLEAASPNTHLAGETVNLVCPVVSADTKQLPQPCIAVSIYDNYGPKERAVIHSLNGDVSGVKLSQVGIAVGILGDANFHEIKRQYEQKYGDNFFLYIDGQKMQIVSESDIMGIADNSNNRHTYFYRLTPPIYRDKEYFTITDRTISAQVGVL